MFLSEPAETPFDLRFWLFTTHVRVSPWFWLLAAFLGYRFHWDPMDTRTSLIYVGVWAACMFGSILLHEFGHVWTGRLFGSHGHIVLFGFGGLAIGSNALNRGWQRFLVSLAGPLIQFVLLGLVLAAWLLYALTVRPAANASAWHEPLEMTLQMLVEINLIWPIFNLLPIWPLDGGQMAREVFVAASPRNGLTLTFGLSALVAGLLAVHCLMSEYNPNWPLRYLDIGGLYMAIFFALFCAQSIMALQAENARRQRYSDDEFPWER